ncbi:MAG: carbon starvation CstA family protein, partial [Bacteroidota bacterium]|nr:carbon starvation CstA family protein [Bacteroidota bacterium]
APRDHLSTYLKIGTIGMLSLGIFYVSPHIVFPAVTQFVHGGGPIIQGTLFPYLFITIACGAISGFHALISSGTTSKMLQKESDARPIAYGGMIVEGFVSLTALIAAVTLSPGDYFYINSSLPDGAMAALGFLPDKIHMFESEIGISLAHRTGGAVTLAVGMANILSGIPFMKSLIAYWYNFALMFEALFILTTIDAGTRVARFLLQDAIGDIYKPMKNYSWLPGTLITSAIVVLLWGSLIWTGSVSTIWPMFGISNQLLAGIALTVATSVLIKMKKIRYIWVTVIPMVFLLVVTLTASVLEVTKYIGLLKQPNLSHQLHITYVFNTILIAFMALLALVIVIDNVRKWGVFSKTPYIEPLSGGERGSTPSLHEDLSPDKEDIGQILKEKPVFATEEATTVDE